jgi:hypothetical protein
MRVLRRLRASADRHGMLLIFDECFTGFGRIGAMFACEAAGVLPDIVVLSKALTSGTLPLAAAVVRRHVFDSLSAHGAPPLSPRPTPSGFQALKSAIDLDIRRGEIFALLGPNGAGKTTLIGIVCGIVNADNRPRHGRRPRHVTRLPRRARHDRPRAAGTAHRRLRVGVGHVRFSRGLFGKPRDPALSSRRC